MFIVANSFSVDQLTDKPTSGMTWLYFISFLTSKECIVCELYNFFISPLVQVALNEVESWLRLLL